MTAANSNVPPAVLRAGRGPLRLLGWGVPMGPLRLLETRGRRTGTARVTPVAVLNHNGQLWLVSPFGETQWVRNVRANGAARLGRGRRLRPVSLQEVTDERRPVVLQHYRRAFRVVPFVRGAFDVDPSSLDDFARSADRYPVFLIAPGDVGSP